MRYVHFPDILKLVSTLIVNILKLVSTLTVYQKFVVLFVDCGGVHRLTVVPVNAQTFMISLHTYIKLV